MREIIKINNNLKANVNSKLIDLYINNLENEYELVLNGDDPKNNIAKNTGIIVMKVIFESITRCLAYNCDHLENGITPVVYEIGTEDELIAFAQLSFKNNRFNYTINFGSERLPSARLVIDRDFNCYRVFEDVAKYHFGAAFYSVDMINILTVCLFKTIKEYLLNSNCNEIIFKDTFRAKLLKNNKCIIEPIGYNKFIIDELDYNTANIETECVIRNLQ